MSELDPKFLAEVQRAGWQIVTSDENRVLAGCPRYGCGLKVAMSPEKPIPKACRQSNSLNEIEVQDFEDVRAFLRRRRLSLGLSIRDVEEIAGMTSDYLAKFEKDGPSKFPNVPTFIDWANSLGYRVSLRPYKLPAYAMRVMTEKRRAIARRRKVVK